MGCMKLYSRAIETLNFQISDRDEIKSQQSVHGTISRHVFIRHLCNANILTGLFYSSKSI